MVADLRFIRFRFRDVGFRVLGCSDVGLGVTEFMVWEIKHIALLKQVATVWNWAWSWVKGVGLNFEVEDWIPGFWMASSEGLVVKHPARQTQSLCSSRKWKGGDIRMI